MKIAEASAGVRSRRTAGGAVRTAPVPAGSAVDDARTRDRVRLGVLEHGPVTASELAERLGLTPSAVRRHLDALESAGLITQRSPSPTPGGRGRGRPARRFVLTPAGHASAGTGYDALAVAALGYLRDSGGDDAVRAFAQARVAEWETRYRATVEAAGPSVPARAEALAGALSDDGYAATTRRLEGPAPAGEGGITSLGTQLCQGHCPVQRVAARFPELCEAEAEAFGRLLGVHVQRLATLAHGEHVCTTHIPNPPLGGATVHDHERTSR